MLTKSDGKLIEMNRRKFLKSVMGGHLGMLSAVNTPEVSNIQDWTEKINAEKEFDDLNIVEVSEKVDTLPKIAPPGVMFISWSTLPGESKLDLSRLRKSVTIEMKLNGSPVRNLGQYWRTIIQLPSGSFRLLWEKPISDLESGFYRYIVSVKFNQSYRHKSPEGNYRVWEGTHQFKGKFEVIN